MILDSPFIMSAVFQRCRTRANPRRLVDALALASDLGDVLTLASDILSVVDQQGKFLIDVPEGWVPHKWVSAVRADTQRGIDYMEGMQFSDYDVLTPEKRRQISLLQLLVGELQRLLAIGENFTVYRLGVAFHNVHRGLRAPEEPDSEYSMVMFRIISADWDMLSLGMREGCCRIVGLELQAAEALINTPGFSINTNGVRRFKINTLLARSTALHEVWVRVLGTVRGVTVPPIPVGEDCTMHNCYALVLEDETGSIVVKVIGKCRPDEPVPSYYQGKRVVIDGIFKVQSQGLTNSSLVRLEARAENVRLVAD